jgi:carbamoyltransferase
MVKKREAYRPFAPSVLEEYVDEFFECPPDTKQFPFMTFVLKVRKEKQQILGAVTHVDGTARIQTVSRKTNPRFWELIEAFRKLSGIPVLLNTSFNNNVEPIVDSVKDAIICYLTSRLHYLVVGNYLVSKKSVNFESYLNLVPSLPLYASLLQSKRFTSSTEMSNFFGIGNSYDECEVPITFEAFNLLAAADKNRTLADLMSEQGVTRDKERAIIAEITELWSRRLVVLEPHRGQ